jgi:hypothetical protein
MVPMTGDLRPGFTTVYLNLSAILRKYSGESLVLKESRSDSIELIGPSTPYSRGKEVWFGAVRIGKNYVSYHLMPIYAFPDLLEGISPELRKRMQGKSCFNFTRVDEGLFHELEDLTKKGYQRYKNEGMID